MKKTCTVSGKSFEITEDDLKFYKKMGVPTPTLCPEERSRQRLAWRNERRLYQRKCDLCNKMMISLYDNSAKQPIHCQSCWWGNDWEAKRNELSFDFSRPFFEQFAELSLQTPRMAMAESHCENSKYAPFSIYTKNGYLAVSCCYSEDVYYSYQANRSQDCVDCSLCDKCELGYENINCQNCFEVLFSSFSRNCSSAWFLNNCIGCSHCFGCVNLRNKQYYFLNKKYTKEEYEKKISELNLHSGKTLTDFSEKFLKFIQTHPHRYFYGEKNENSTGNDIFNCKNSKECFECRDLEDCKFCGPHPSPGGRDCYDTMYSPSSELLYNVLSGVNGYNLAFSIFSWDVKDSVYVNECFYSHDLFGCIGLKHAQYCILNKQYSREEYLALREKIIKHMKKTGEWGEFFPINLSPFAYNETIAQEYFPLNENKITENGWDYKEEKQHFKYDGPKYITPENIQDTSVDILNKILTCKATDKHYKIQKKELEFYRKMNLPIPRLCPDERHKRRMSLRNPRKLWTRTCNKCGVEIQTTFTPDRPEKIYCEKCYLKEIN